MAHKKCNIHFTYIMVLSVRASCRPTDS